MTLIIGIKCQDGIVVAADGLASYATPFGQAQSIKQPTSKLSIIANKIILGVSGPVGLGQSYRYEIEAQINNKGNKVTFPTELNARDFFQKAILKHAEVAWKSTQMVAPVIGPGASIIDANHSTIVALPVGDQPHLIQFSAQCQPEDATTNLPFIAIGSGQIGADLFLAFIRRILWSNSQPSIDDGVFAAVWTLEHISSVQYGGIGGQIQVVTLRKDQNHVWNAKELTSDVLGEHKQMIETIESGMRETINVKFKSPPTIPALP